MDKAMTLRQHLADRSGTIAWAFVLSVIIGVLSDGLGASLLIFLVFLFFIIG